MGTVLRRSYDQYLSVGSTRLVTIPTNPTTKITLTPGYNAMYIANVGAATIAWGDTGLLASSGGLLFYSMGKEFMNIADGFTFYVIADSASSKLVINEFQQ